MKTRSQRIIFEIRLVIQDTKQLMFRLMFAQSAEEFESMQAELVMLHERKKTLKTDWLKMKLGRAKTTL